MPNNDVFISKLFLTTLCVCLMFVCGGCAASSATIIEKEVVTNPKPMYSYTSLVINDFELRRELYSDALDAAGMSQRESVGSMLVDLFGSLRFFSDGI